MTPFARRTSHEESASAEARAFGQTRNPCENPAVAPLGRGGVRQKRAYGKNVGRSPSFHELKSVFFAPFTQNRDAVWVHAYLLVANGRIMGDGCIYGVRHPAQVPDTQHINTYQNRRESRRFI